MRLPIGGSGGGGGWYHLNNQIQPPNQPVFNTGPVYPVYPSSLVQQWRSYCSPSGQGGAGYSSHKRAEPEEEREHARKVSYVVTSVRSSLPKHPSPRLGSVAVLGPSTCQEFPLSCFSRSFEEAADHRDQGISSQVPDTGLFRPPTRILSHLTIFHFAGVHSPSRVF